MRRFTFLAIYLLIINVSFAYTAADYFPLIKGSYWKYQQKGAEAWSEISINNYFNAYGFKVFDFEGKWYLANGELVSTFINSYSHDTYGTINRIIQGRKITINQFIGEKLDEYDPVLVILNSPIKVGNKWLVGNVTNVRSEKAYRKIVGIGTIKTPAGTFDNSIKIKETIYVGSKKWGELYYWYAPNVGLVKDPILGELVEYNIPKEEKDGLLFKDRRENIPVSIKKDEQLSAETTTAEKVTAETTNLSTKGIQPINIDIDIGQSNITQPGTKAAISIGIGVGSDNNTWYGAMGMSFKEADFKYYEFYGKVGAKILRFLSIEGGLGWQYRFLGGDTSYSSPLSSYMTYLIGIRIHPTESFSIYCDHHNTRGYLLGIGFNI